MTNDILKSNKGGVQLTYKKCKLVSSPSSVGIVPVISLVLRSLFVKFLNVVNRRRKRKGRARERTAKSKTLRAFRVLWESNR